MNLRIGININWFARLHGAAFQNIVPIFVSRFPRFRDATLKRPIKPDTESHRNLQKYIVSVR
jgi:hypothetical protein